MHGVHQMALCRYACTMLASSIGQAMVPTIVLIVLLEIEVGTSLLPSPPHCVATCQGRVLFNPFSLGSSMVTLTFTPLPSGKSVMKKMKFVGGFTT